MILLGLDTCGATGSLALAEVVAGEVRLLGSAESAGRTSAAMLVPMLRQMLDEAGVELGRVDGVVVVDGPGSFTGIRIGLSAAKALAEALGCGVFAISRLRVMAVAQGASCAVLDAGRGEFYLGSYAGEQGEWLLTRAELAPWLDGAAVACEEKVAAVGVRLVEAPTAFDAVRAALPEVLAGRGADVSSLDGRYLRRSDLYSTAASSAAL